MEEHLHDRTTSSDFLYQQLPNGFISFREDGRIIRINRTMCNWLQKTEEELLHANFMSLLGKGSLLYYNLVINPLLLVKSEVNEVNLKFSSPEGNFDTLFNAISYVNEGGQTWLINCTVQKITDRKRYEVSLLADKRRAEEERRRFEFLYNLVPAQLWTAAADGTFVSVNEKFGKYFGHFDLSALSRFEHIIEEDRGMLLEVWSASIISGHAFEVEARVKNLRGSFEWFLICAEPYFNDHGQIEAWYGSSINVHKQKTVHLSQISNLTNNLKVAEQTISANQILFMNIATDQSHMVRKPLANIIGLVELLKYQELDEASRDLIRLITESTDELDVMIRTAASAMHYSK